MRFNYGKEVIRYQGERERSATIEVDGQIIALDLANTWRCTEGEKITAGVLRALCEAHGVRLTDSELRDEAIRLTQHCREVTKYDPTAPRRSRRPSKTLRSLSWRV